VDEPTERKPGSTVRGLIGRALAVAAVALVVAAPMASAHVTPEPTEAPRGGYATVRFRVPNEEQDASTTQVEINFPTDTPFPSVAVEPVPGWRYQTETTELDEPVDTESGQISEAVTKVTFSGGEIRPGEFQEFAVQLGPLPTEGDQVVFPTLQTYDNGEVVRWIEEPAADGAEPEFPAPALTLTDPEDEGGGSAAPDAAGGGEDSAAATDDDVSAATTVGVVGIVVGAVGLATAIFALVTNRRRTQP
jgi:uncharacterized protein YcnI